MEDWEQYLILDNEHRFFYWSVISLRCYFGLCCTTKWVSYVPAIYPLPPEPPSHASPHPALERGADFSVNYFLYGQPQVAGSRLDSATDCHQCSYVTLEWGHLVQSIGPQPGLHIFRAQVTGLCFIDEL